MAILTGNDWVEIAPAGGSVGKNIIVPLGEALISLGVPDALTQAIKIGGAAGRSVVEGRSFTSEPGVAVWIRALSQLVTYTIGDSAGQGGGTPVPTRLAGNNQLYALGDSRTLDNFRPNALAPNDDDSPELTNGMRANIGPVNHARAVLRGKADFRKEWCNGEGGETSAGILANQFPAALASSCKILMLLAGVNSTNSGSVTAAEAVGHIATMATQWAESEADRVALLWDEVPCDNLDNAKHAAIRDGIRALHDPAAGIYVMPTWNEVATSPDSNSYDAAYFRDNLHWNVTGAQRLGRDVLAPAIAAVLPVDAVEAHARPGVLPSLYGLDANSEFQTSGGLVTGWTQTAITGVTYSSEVADSHIWLVVTVSNVVGLNGSGIIFPSASTVPAGFTAGTSGVDGCMLVKRLGLSNIVRCDIEQRKQSGTRLFDRQQRANVFATDLNTSGSGTYATYGFIEDSVDTEILWIDNGFLDAAATQLRPWWINIVGLPGSPASGVFKFALPQLRGN
jgi:hypothetical protein